MNQIGQHNCAHSEDMGITCAGSTEEPEALEIMAANNTTDAMNNTTDTNNTTTNDQV